MERICSAMNEVTKIIDGATILMDMPKGAIRQRFATFLYFVANKLINLFVNYMSFDIDNAGIYETEIHILLTMQGLMKKFGLNDMINYSDNDIGEPNF